MPEQKYGSTLDKQYHMRVTQAQLDALLSVQNYAGSASEFWRDYNLFTANEIPKLQAGIITPAEFGAKIADFVSNYPKASLVDDATADKDEP